MPRTILRALTALTLVAMLAACGGAGGDSEAEVKAKVAAQYEDSGLDKAGAKCFADVLVDEIGLDNLKDVDFSADEPPAGLEDEYTAAAIKARADCNIDASELNG